MKVLFLLLIFCSSLAQAQDLKLMTWNVFMLPKPIKNSFQKTRSNMIAQRLLDSDRDVILFQEAFSGYFQKKILKTLKEKYPYQLKLRKKTFPIIALGPGILLVSRYPVKVLGHTYYKDCRTFDCYATKGALLFEVSLPGGKVVQIANTHLQSGQGDESKLIRTEQIAQIHELLEKHKKENVAQILSGDLNISIEDAEFSRTLQSLEMKSIELPDETTETSVELQPKKFSFFTAGFKLECYEKREGNPKLIDHVLYRSNGASLKFAGDRVNQFEGLIDGRSCPLSDHHARQVDLHLL